MPQVSHHETFYQSNVEKVLHLNFKDSKHELRRLKLTTNKGSKRKLVNFQGFPDSAHLAELERYQGEFKLDDKYPFHYAHGSSTYDLHYKNWKSHIGIKNPSNFKADSKISSNTIRSTPQSHPKTPRPQIHARKIKFHQKFFNESILSEKSTVNLKDTKAILN